MWIYRGSLDLLMIRRRLALRKLVLGMVCLCSCFLCTFIFLYLIFIRSPCFFHPFSPIPSVWCCRLPGIMIYFWYLYIFILSVFKVKLLYLTPHSLLYIAFLGSRWLGNLLSELRSRNDLSHWLLVVELPCYEFGFAIWFDWWFSG